MKAYRYDETEEAIGIEEIKDQLEIAKELADPNRCIKRTRVGEVEISTVYLVIDHSRGADIPLLWETMIFGGKYHGYQRRYTTKDQALAGHQDWVDASHCKKKPRYD